MEGFVKAPHDLIRDPALSPAAKVAWLLIAGMPDGYNPAREQWMAMLPCGDKRTWWRVVAELEAAGLIEVTRQGSKKIYTALQGGVKQHPQGVQNNTDMGCETTPVQRCETTPHKKNIEEQEKNIPEVRARLREEVTCDMMVEMGCRSADITPEQYRQLADQIFNDWTFQDLPDHEWTKSHFLGVLRIKARELKNQNNNGQRIINADPVARRQMERQQRVQDIAAATAAFAAQGQRPTTEVF